VFVRLTGVLRRRLRQKEGKAAEPFACVIDAQSVKTSTRVPAAGQGADAGKKTMGRRRSIVTNALGPLLAVLVTAVSVPDSVASTDLFDQVATAHPQVRTAWWTTAVTASTSPSTPPALSADREIVQRALGARDFTPLPKR